MRREPGFALLLLCFFLSGFAALVYQTAWTRQFEFVFGTSELAIATVLAAYMGGLASGAAAAARLAPRIRRPLLAYALLELGIAGAALAVPLGLAGATALWVAAFGGRPEPPAAGGAAPALFSLAASFAVLWLPTALMGATLPLLARHAVRRESEIGPRVGALYAVNTVGAVLGTCAAGFALLPRLGLAHTIYVGVGANALVFAAAALLSRRSAFAPPEEPPAGAPPRARRGRWILPLVCASGAVSFGYEVLWSRLLGHLLGSSVSAFATMLASFLAGIALGSAVGSRLATGPERAARRFAGAQLGAALLSFAAFAAIDRMPAWSDALALRGGTRAIADAAAAAATLLPAALCIGATFPLAVRVLARDERDAAPASARVFAWNTGGAIAGALGTGFLLLPAVGYAGALSLGIAVNLALAVAAAAPGRSWRWRAVAIAAAGIACLAALPPALPWNLLRASPVGGRLAPSRIVHFGVGRSATVLLATQNGGWRLRSNGLSESWIAPRGALSGSALPHWLGAIATLARPQARSLLVVGLGGGVVLEAIPPQIERVDVIEIEEEVVRANRAVAAQRRGDPLADPRVAIIANDARGALLLTDKRYDAIVSQPSHPWTAGASHLYTREFFELAREHLTPGGVFVQWMGLHFVDEALLRTLVGTLAQAFPHVRVYEPAGALVFLASDRPLPLESTAPAAIAGAASTYAQFGVYGAEDVAAFLALDESGARAFSAGAPVNTDDHNRVQMHSARLARQPDGRLRPDALWASLDPLVGRTPGLDRPALVRRLLARGRRDRALRVARASRDPVARATSLGWVALATGRPERARERFEEALAIAPEAVEARIGLLRLGRDTGGAAPPAGDARGLAAPQAAVVAGWEPLARGEAAPLRALDAQLARVSPRDPLYPDAVRERVTWRLATGDAGAAREAVALLDLVIPVSGAPRDWLLRARAAAAAGDAVGAWATLFELSTRLKGGPDHGAIAREALTLLATLPESAGVKADRRRLDGRLRRALR